MNSTDLMSLGVMSTSRKRDERRLPIHPRHFERIDKGFEWRNVPPATLFWAWKD